MLTMMYIQEMKGRAFEQNLWLCCSTHEELTERRRQKKNLFVDSASNI